MEIINGTNLQQTKQNHIDKEKWSKLIAEWKDSAESQKEFCKRLNLNIHTFTYIKGKLSVKDKKNKFIPLTIRKEIPPKPISNMILENAKGMKLHIPLAVIDENFICLLKIAGW